ncbi:MAG TPA: CpsD/CapB family tyrosine-protein kinase [Bacillota bacterium]|nr:CpsD/CapB family tyrosine-protein kinase [Bacillota bacterium]
MANYQLIVHEQVKSPIAEAYRTLRTNIQFAKINNALKTIMFTSTGPGEGKSTTAANTAVALAQTGKRVILIDCDLRKPVQHKIFGLLPQGITNLLVENRTVASQLQNTMVKNLRVLGCGPIPPNPSELLGSEAMDQLLITLKNESDVLIVDAPPVMAVTDAGVLASKVDGIIMVISSRMVRPELAQRAKELLLRANGNILGVVLNRVELNKDELHYYHYYGQDGQAN